MSEAEIESHVVGFHDALATAKADGNEVLQELEGHVDELGEAAHDDHVGRSGLPRLLGELVEGNADATVGGVSRVGSDGGIEEDHTAFADLDTMLLVRMRVERDEYVDGVAGAEDGETGDSGLGPGRATEYLGGESGEGEGVVSDSGGSPGQHLRRGNDSLTPLTRKADNDLTSTGHRQNPPRDERNSHPWRNQAAAKPPFLESLALQEYAPGTEGVKRCFLDNRLAQPGETSR